MEQGLQKGTISQSTKNSPIGLSSGCLKGLNSPNFPSIIAGVGNLGANAGALRPTTSITLGATHTVSFWINIPTTWNGWGGVFEDWNGGASGVGIYIPPNTSNLDYYYNGSHVIAGAGAIKQNTWNHVFLTSNSQAWTAYINNKKTTTGSRNGFTFGGCFNDATSEYGVCILSEIMVWTRISLPSEICARLYNNPYPYYAKNIYPEYMQCYWPLNQHGFRKLATGEKTFDISDKKNHGTFTAGTSLYGTERDVRIKLT